MLTQKNKKAIDSCRQILLNKIPSPEGQIEQVTMAMLYKFMDDMDKQSMLLGGKAKFFVGEYEKTVRKNFFVRFFRFGSIQ